MVESSVDLQVHWGDTDMAGIIFYPNYFRWFDISSHQLLINVGLSPKEFFSDSKIAFPILDVACSFKKPLYYQDQIRVISRVVEVKDRTFHIEHTVYCGQEVTGVGHELRGFVEVENGLRLRSIPEEMRRKLTEGSGNTNLL